MGKETPSAPDPTTTAAAQTQSNEQTAAYNQKLNMINSTGPDGSVTYTPSSAPGGYSQTTSLSPAEQAIFNQQTSAESGALGVANDQLGRVSSALGTSIDPSSFGTLQTSANGGAIQGSLPSAGAIQTGYGSGGSIQTGLPSAGAIQTGYGSGGSIQSSLGQTAPVQTGYDAGGQIQNQVNPASMGDPAIAQAENAAYDSATQYLTPQYQQASAANAANLAAQGLNVNDAAYQNQTTLLNNQQNQGYQAAANAAVAAGQQEQNTLYGQNLSSGEFADQAQAQQNSENAAQATFANAGAAQEFGQGLQAGQFANSAQSQANSQSAAQAAFANSAQGQQYSQGLSTGQFANSAQAQGNSQNAAAAAFADTAQGQQYSEGLQSGDFANAAQNQGYTQGYQNASLNNTAQQQAFQQGTYAQELPINEFSSLLGLGQVASPTGVNYSPASAANTDVAGITQASFADQAANDKVTNAATNSSLGGLFNLGMSFI